MAVIGQAVSHLFAQRAPGLRLRITPHSNAVVDNAAEMLRTVDNDQVGDRITMDDLARLPWVLTYQGPTAYTPAARQLQLLGVEPQAQVVVESFLALPYHLAGTNRVALAQSRLVPRLVSSGDVRALPCQSCPPAGPLGRYQRR
jgi:hypothetical protein